jgi:hypothetical protein
MRACVSQLLSLLTLLPLGSCVPEFATDLSQIDEPRVLAIAASPAEAQPRQTVQLTALVVGPEGEPTPDLDWRVCLARKPLTELGAVSPECLSPRPAAGAVQKLGRRPAADFILDPDVCKSFGPLRPTPMSGEPSGRPVDPDITGGFYQPVVGALGENLTLGTVRIACDQANVNREQALELKQRYRPNEAPHIASVAWSSDGSAPQSLSEETTRQLSTLRASELRVSWDECPTESVCGDGLCTAFEDNNSCMEDCGSARKGCTGAEPYVWYDRESAQVQPRREGISVAWYTSNGHFDDEQTGLDEAEAKRRNDTRNVWRPASAGPATVWLVIRDTRGGLSWKTFHFELSL